MKILLKWLLPIAITAISAVVLGFILIGIINAGAGIADWTTKAVWSVGEVFIGLANLFLLKFVILTAIYVVGFTAIAASIYWIASRFTDNLRTNQPQADGPPASFRALWKAAFKKLSDNNVRWFYLAAMTVLTLILGISYAGAPLLQSSAQELPDAALSKSAQNTIVSDWQFFLHGDEASQPQAPPLERTPSWFFWHAFSVFALLTFVYFFFAFSDEFKAAMKKMVEVYKKHRAKHQREQRRAAKAAKASPPPAPAPIPTAATAPASGTPSTGQTSPTQTSPATVSQMLGIPPVLAKLLGSTGWFVIIDLALEAILAALKEFFVQRHQRKGGLSFV